MIVLDASAAVELLLRSDGRDGLETQIFAAAGGVHAPALIDAEVLHALRRYERAGDLTEARAQEAVIDLHDLPLSRYPLLPLMHAAWELRRNLSAYDAFYVVLAEALGAALVTADRRMASAVGEHTDVAVTLVE